MQSQISFSHVDLMQAVIKAWSDVLEVNAQFINAEANFYALGGDSMSMIKVVSQLEDQYKVDIPFEELYDLDNLAHWTQFIEECLMLQAVSA